MKISIIQITLGLLLVLSAILFSGLIESGYWQTKGIDGEYGVMSNGNPGANTAMRTWLLCYAGLGLAIQVASIVSLFLKARSSKAGLAMVLTILGGLVIVSLVVFMLWMEPDWSSYLKYMESVGSQVLMHHDPAWVVTQIIWKVVSFLVGLGVVGVAWLQLLRLKRLSAVG
jgi:hypothetical protein